MATTPPLPDGFVIESAPPAPRARPTPAFAPVSDGRSAALSVYPDLQITQVERNPYSRLGRANPNSWHNRSHAAIDARPVRGMTFDDYVNGYRSAGYHIIEARDEVNHPSGHATGPHWHIVLGGGPVEGTGDDSPDLPPLPEGFQLAHIPAPGLRPSAPTVPGDQQTVPPPALPGGPGLNQSAGVAAPPDPDIQAAVQSLAPPPSPRFQTGPFAYNSAGVREQEQAATAGAPPPPAGYVADPNNVATEHSAPANEVPTAVSTTRDDPRLRGFNDQVRSMAMDPSISNGELTAFLLAHGVDRASVPGWDTLMAWREAPARLGPQRSLAAWRRLPARQRGRQGVNLDDIRLPEGQYREVTTPGNVPQGEITNWTPPLSYRIAHALERPFVATGAESERGAAVHAAQNEQILEHPLSPVRAIEDAQDYSQRYYQAQAEGRTLDAAGDQLGGGFAIASIIPIVGRGRAGVQLATRGVEELTALAARNGIREAGPAADAAIARLAEAQWNDLSPETRELLDTVRTENGQLAPLTAAHLSDLRVAANPPPSLVTRARQALHERFGGRGSHEAVEVPEAASLGARGDIPEAPRLPSPASASGPARTVDRIDVSQLPPIPHGFTLEEPLGRVQPLGDQPAPAELADVARSIRPEDVVPIPDNAIGSAEEAARANPGTIQDVRAPAPETMLEMRSIPDPRKPGETIRFRGPVDAESYLRLRGGVNDSEGELRHIGITPADNRRPRPEAPGEHRLGPIISGRGLTLDQAGEALHEAGYLRERPTTADVVDILRESRLGRRLWHDRDLEEVAGHEGAQAQQMQVDAAREAGVPLAERVGHPIGPADLSANEPPATAYEDLPRIGGRVANINLANIESEGDIRRLLQTVEDRFGGLDASRRGKITHAETRALASELGMTADDLLRRRPGQALNAEQALAARQLLAKSSDEVIALAARATGPEASDASRAAFSEALLRHAAIHEQVTGATAEAGRALSAMRAAARSREISGTIHQAAADGMGGQKRLEEVAEKILDLHREGVGPGEVNRFAVRATRPRFRDKLVELWYNSLLSGPRTHAVNILSNLMTAGLQIPEHAAAAGLGAGRRIARALMGKEDDFDRVMASEIGARTFGLMQGTSEGLRAFARTMRTGEVADHVTKVEARTQHAISGLKGSILRTPTRALAAEDEFFKAIGRRMELNGLAVRKATSEGLRGAALRRRIADLSTNPTDEMVSASMAYARYVTFQRPLEPDSLAQGISRLTQNRPWLKLFVPFVRTPANLLKFAVERSPAAFALRSVRADFAAGGARRDLAIARMALGTGLALTVAELASRGIITGGGPADRGALDLMRGDGWQPYSIRIGDKYYSYARLDPLSTTLGITADMVDFNQHMTAGQRQQAGPLLIASIIRNLGNKTWLSGISDVVSAIDDPQRSLPSLIARLGGSIAVPAIVSQTAGVLDPTMRDTRAPTFSTEGVVPEALGLRSVIDPTIATIQSRLPGVSQNLPARRDVWGEPITREGSLGPDIISPFSTSTAHDDPVTAELLNLGASIGRPSRSIQGRRLEPGEYGQYQALSGRYMREDMIETMGGPDWARMTPDERLREIASIKRTARQDARADLLLDAPPLPPGFQAAH